MITIKASGGRVLKALRIRRLHRCSAKPGSEHPVDVGLADMEDGTRMIVVRYFFGESFWAVNAAGEFSFRTRHESGTPVAEFSNAVEVLSQQRGDEAHYIALYCKRWYLVGRDARTAVLFNSERDAQGFYRSSMLCGFKWAWAIVSLLSSEDNEED